MDRTNLRTTWVELIAKERVLTASREALEAAFGTWLELLDLALEGDDANSKELDKLVAHHARSLGLEDRPASAAVLQVQLLSEAMRIVGLEQSDAFRDKLRWLIRIAADAHGLGRAERMTERHHHEIRDFSPVIRLSDGRVVGFLLGPMTGDLIDALLGRLLRECALAEASVAVLDVFGAGEEDDRFRRTIKALLESEVGRKLQLVLTGLRNPAETREALRSLGADLGRIDTYETLSAYLAPGLPAG